MEKKIRNTATAEKFPIVGLQYSPDDHMTEEGMIRLLSKLKPDPNEGKGFEIVYAEGNNAIAMFLVNGEMYDLLPGDVLQTVVREILDDVDLENASGVYTFDPEVPELGSKVTFWLNYL